MDENKPAAAINPTRGWRGLRTRTRKRPRRSVSVIGSRRVGGSSGKRVLHIKAKSRVAASTHMYRLWFRAVRYIDAAA